MPTLIVDTMGRAPLAQAFVLPASPPTSYQVTMAQNPALTQLLTDLNAAPHPGMGDDFF
eukprot:COSAG06_NODE_56868_length_282_cov_3.666667_1_plen_58_part_01